MTESSRKWLEERIVARSTLARGVIVLDSSVAVLASALSEANIKVVELPENASDRVSRKNYLTHRILVTRSPENFLEEAPIYEYGIVSLEKLGRIDANPSFASNQTARLISQALNSNRLWTKGAKFLLELRDDGEHELTPLE